MPEHDDKVEDEHRAGGGDRRTAPGAPLAAGDEERERGNREHVRCVKQQDGRVDLAPG